MNTQPQPDTKTDEPQPRQLTEIRRQPIIVHDSVPVLDTGRFEQMQRIASAMAATSLIPKALKGDNDSITIANCFLIVNQAVRWQMDPFALAQHAFVLQGKLGYEGKVIAAVVNGHRGLTGKLSYAYDNEGQNRRVTVSGTLKGETEPRTINGCVREWATQNEKWKLMGDQMLAYRGAREWARRHMPEAVLGVYADDDLEDMRFAGDLQEQSDGTFAPAPPRPQRKDYRQRVEEAKSNGAPTLAGKTENWPLIDHIGETVGDYIDSWAWANAFVELLSTLTDKAKVGLPALETYIDNNRPVIARLKDDPEAADLVNRNVEAAKANIGGKSK